MFKVGDRVYHIAARRYGVIEQERHDSQQRRYAVRHSGWLWSVFEEGLRVNAKKTPKSPIISTLQKSEIAATENKRAS